MKDLFDKFAKGLKDADFDAAMKLREELLDMNVP